MSAGIGRRNKRVTVERSTSTLNGMRQPEKTWSALTTVWGFVRSPNGREVEVASQQRATVSRVVECQWSRCLANLSPLDRLKVDGNVFNIGSVVDPDGRRMVLLITCTEVVAPK